MGKTAFILHCKRRIINGFSYDVQGDANPYEEYFSDHKGNHKGICNVLFPLVGKISRVFTIAEAKCRVKAIS